MRKSVLFGGILLLLAGCAGSAGRGPVVVSSDGRVTEGKPLTVATTAATADPAATDTGIRPDVGTTTPARAGAWVGAAPENDVLLAGSDTTAIGVWVDAPTTQPRTRVPMDVSLVIDTSGSMAGAKIDNARRAAGLLIDDLANGDIVSIVAFSDDAKTVLEPTVLTAQTRTALKARIAKLQPNGSTNMFDGLGLGETHVARAPTTHAVRRVVVISDGIANVGPSSPEALGALAERGLRFHAQVTSLGVGTDYDERTLDSLAVRSTGRLYHLTDPREMASLVQHELDLLRSTVATDAFVEVVPAPGVDLVAVEGCRSERGEGGALKLPLGALFSGQHREALVRVRMHDTMVTPQRAIASIRLHFRDPDDGDVPRIQEIVARAGFSSDPGVVAKSENARTRSIAAILDASKLELVASQSVNSGQFADADKQLAQAQRSLESRAAATTDENERGRLVAVAKKVAGARASVQAAPSAPAAARRATTLELNAAGMHDSGF
jgi:Ca-activated chloride channel family protein